MSIRLENPAGSDPFGPSPLCASITPSSESEEARFRHIAAFWAIFEDLMYNIIPELEYVRRVTIQTEQTFYQTDTRIENQVRCCPWAFLLHAVSYATAQSEELLSVHFQHVL